MNNSQIFNATVCIIGIFIFLIHIANIMVKKEKRKDELCLLNFFVFTAIHFSIYLTFTIIRMSYTSNELIIAFYTSFYIMNNIELLLFFAYMKSLTTLPKKSYMIINIVNISTFIIITILDILNIFIPMFFTANNGVYVRSSTMFLSQSYQFIMFTVSFFLAIFYKGFIIREKIAFSLYCILPAVAIIFQNIYEGYAIAYVSIIISTEILFVVLNAEKNIELSKEKEKAKDAQIRIMLSQIQPHFVYNSLSAISTLISIDPDKAQNALDDFTEYLRRNLSSLTETKLIPFEDELRHIYTYVSLEKLRFEDRINIVYELGVTDFYIPVLTVQPIVENAIKHGILKKVEGGTLKIKTYENEKSYVVEIEDDGVGFDLDKKDNQNVHFGLNNIKYRIQKMSKGDILIKSEVGKGTHVTINFNK